ncbi:MULTISPECIES: hypothetical protein [Halorussus]|uniref:hypothetical protein n=1 Tax=Halorussus TaxID=1070314 RepID=UPI0020A0EC38|nr:hypothetical protein [Halorussus vallis]USZ76287.1 hypothetical protein NGM07_02920 [Halorussus vallis]
MIWQDVVFLAGNVFSLLVLVPTLRDEMANVPLGTALPSALIGGIYGTAFLTMGMTLSAFGALLTGLMWSLIAYLRSPNPLADDEGTDTDDELRNATDVEPESQDEGGPAADTPERTVPSPRSSKTPAVSLDD